MPGMGKERNHDNRPPAPRRCLNTKEAAAYLGIGITLLKRIGPASIKLGHRRVYDILDLDRWLDEYKQRGRAEKEDIWPVNEDSTKERTRLIDGSMSSSPTAAEYAKALDWPGAKTPKNT